MTKAAWTMLVSILGVLVLCITSAHAKPFPFHLFIRKAGAPTYRHMDDYPYLATGIVTIADSTIQPNAFVPFTSLDFLGLEVQIITAVRTYTFTWGIDEWNLAGSGRTQGLLFDSNAQPLRFDIPQLSTSDSGYFRDNSRPWRGKKPSFTLWDEDKFSLVVLKEPARIFNISYTEGAIVSPAVVPAGIEVIQLNGTWAFNGPFGPSAEDDDVAFDGLLTFNNEFVPQPIALTDVKITQAVFDNDGIVDLVLNRKTAILLTLDVAHTVSQPVVIEARLEDAQGQPIPLDTHPKSVILAPGNNQGVAIFFTPNRQQGIIPDEYKLIVEIDPKNEIPNRNDNPIINKKSFIKFHQTKTLTLAYVHLKPSTCFSTDCSMTPLEVDLLANASNEFISDTYPLADDGLSFNAFHFETTGENNIGTFPASTPCGIIPNISTGFIQDLRTLRRSYPSFKRVIGVVSSGYFRFHSIPQNVTGLHHEEVDGAVIVRSGFPISTAHELGHTFGFEEGYEADNQCLIKKLGDFVDGFNVKTGEILFPALDFMGSGKWTGDFWISTDHWKTLLQKLSLGAPDPELIFIDATIYKDGTIELGSWPIFDGTPDIVKPGEYTIEMRDAAGEPISVIPFKLSFYTSMEPYGRIDTGVAPFGRAVPYPLAAASVAIIAPDGTVLAKVDPVYKTLSDAVDTLPDECFTSGLLQKRQTLKNDMTALKALLDGSDWAGAIAKLDKDTRADVTGTLQAQCGGTHLITTKEKLLDLIENAITHLQNRIVVPVRGDLNDDGHITPADALMAFRHFLGLTTLSVDQQTRADVNQDGRITPMDALCIFQHFLKISSCLSTQDL